MPRRSLPHFSMLVLAALATLTGAATARTPRLPAPGEYRCQIAREYKFRPCTITRDRQGQTRLEIPGGGLLGISGTLQRSGRYVFFDGHLNEPRPWGCFVCQERCARHPTACVCRENEPQASKTCRAQPMTALLTGGHGRWSGVLPYRRPTVAYTTIDGVRQPSGTDWELDTYRFVIKRSSPRTRPSHRPRPSHRRE